MMNRATDNNKKAFEQKKSVGHSYPRTDALSKAKGKAQYTDDLFFPDLCYAIILRSPYSHARVKSLDVESAKAVSGIIEVLTPDDVTQKYYNSSGNPPSGLIIPDETVLTWEPKYQGDRVAVVMGEDISSCEKAIEALKPEYEVLPSYMSVHEALADDAMPLQPHISKDNNIMKHLIFTEGDVEQGMKEADFIIEDTFNVQAVHQLYMEPTACVCMCDADGSITVWSPSQTPFQERRIVAELLGVKEKSVRFIKPAMGGGFGARQQLHNQHIGAILAKKTGRTVKILNTREEDIFTASTRHATECTIRMGVMNDGYIKAVSIYNLLNGGPYITHTPTVSAAAGRKFQYHTDNYRYDGISVYTNSPTAGAMRGYGNFQVVIAREIMMDRIARKLDVDPVALRLKYHLGVGDHFPAAGYDILSCNMEELVNKADAIKKEIDKEAPLRDDEEVKESWGVAFCCHSSGPSNRDGMSSAVVMANDDGSIVLSIGSADIGQGSETVMAQIAADALAVPFEYIYVSAADTGTNPYDTGTFASGQTYVCGNAVNIACHDLRNNIAKGLANYYDVSFDAINDDGQLFNVLDAGRKVQLTTEEAIQKIAFGMKGMVAIGQGSYKAVGSPPPFAICYAKARYHRKLKTIKITDLIEVVDVGTAINPGQVEAQVHGGVAMGYGYAMMEELEYNLRVNKSTSSNLLHFKGPLMIDMPRVYVDIAEDVYEETGPFGAKSVGELSAIPIAPAIANAVTRASGKEISSLPLSRQFAPDNSFEDARDPMTFLSEQKRKLNKENSAK